MANPYSVNFSNIPFSAAPGAMFSGLGGTPQQAMAALGPAYQQSYSAALDFNRSLGDTINTGFNNAMTQQLAGQQGINDTIANYGNSARTDISAANTKQQGDMMQSMISRGLGNTTVLDSGTRGLSYDLQRQNLQLDDQLASMKAGYQNQFNQQNTSLAQNQLGFLNSMTGQYPNAGLYGQLAGQFGAAGQSAQNQGAINDALSRARQAAGGAPVSGAIGGGGGARPQSAFAPSYSAPQSPGYGSVGIGANAYSPAPSFGQYSTGMGDSGDPSAIPSYYDAGGSYDPWNDVSSPNYYDPGGYSLNDLYGTDVGASEAGGTYNGYSMNDLYGDTSDWNY